MTEPQLDEVFKFGPFCVEPGPRKLYKGTRNVKLGGKPFDILVELCRAHGKTVTYEGMLSRIWSHVKEPDALDFKHNVQTKVGVIRRAISDLKKEIIINEPDGYRLYYKSDERAGIHERLQVIPSHLEKEKEQTTVIPAGFNVVVDGMIINSVAEFLQDDPETRPIRQICRASYERSLEDLAFALVCASHIVTAKDFRPSVATQDQPGKELARRLGEICKQGAYPAEIEGGRLLNDEVANAGIKADIHRLASCIADNRWRHFFRDYMKRESLKHLGEHSSLFRKDLDPDKYKFKTVMPYYQNRSLQNSLGSKATDTLVSFLPKGPGASKDRYAINALREFATRNVLSLITIMWESNRFADENDSWRVRHVLRALVLERSFGAGKVDQQKYLREIIVQHALGTALRHMRTSTKENIVTVLLNQRDEYPFNEVRKILENEHLVFLSDDPSDEKKAQRVLRMINSHALQDCDQDSIRLKRDRSTLRQLRTMCAPEYEAALYHVFPALSPAASV